MGTGTSGGCRIGVKEATAPVPNTGAAPRVQDDVWGVVLHPGEGGF